MKTMTRLGFCIGALLALSPGPVQAGGFEFPANGTEALGRGGAFTAKADSPLALEYNVAGLAGQRGTRLLFDSNLLFSNYSLQRTGPYPLVTDQASKPFFAPWFGLSTDFGYFDRWTFAIGAYGPSSVGQRSYDPKSLTRYDVSATDILVILPTLAVGFRVNRHLDLGLAFHDAIGNFNLSNTAYSVLGGPCSVTTLNPDCDSNTQVKVHTYFNPMLSLGVLIHPTSFFDIGFHVRTSANVGAKKIQATGSLTATQPKFLSPQPMSVTSDDTTFQNDLPWIFRLGLRYAYKKQHREVFDLELDATYELWSQAEGTGDTLNGTNPVTMSDLGGGDGILLPHHYNDTYSIRFGGAFNQPIGPLVLTLRAGVFFDSSATASQPEYTRLDFDSLDKIGGSAGLGLTLRGVTLNLAYAGIHALDRTVQNGALLPLDGITGRPLVGGAAVNNGTYTDTIHVVSAGLLIQFDELVRGDAWARKPRP